MRQDARRVNPLVRRIQEYERLAASEVSNTYLLEKALVPIKKLLDEISASENKQHLGEWYACQLERIQQLKDEFRYRFGTDLKQALEKHGLTLEGQFPVLRAGLYAVKLNFDTGFAGIFWGPEIEPIRAKVKLSIADIEKTVAGFDRKLKGTSLKAAEFLKSLLQGYDRLLDSVGLPKGNRVFLTELLREIVFSVQSRKFAVNPTRENFQEYSRIQFGYDLFRLKQSNQLAGDNRRLHLSVATFDSTTDRGKSLWVPDNERGEGTFYSYASFVED